MRLAMWPLGRPSRCSVTESEIRPADALDPMKEPP